MSKKRKSNTSNFHSHQYCPVGKCTVYYPREVRRGEYIGGGGIPVTILPSCQDMKTITLQLHEHEYSWVVKIRTSQMQYSGCNTPLGHHTHDTDRGPIGLGQYYSPEEYCSPHIASFVCLIISSPPSSGRKNNDESFRYINER